LASSAVGNKKGVVMTVQLSPVPESDLEEFAAQFQDYLRELSAFNGARPNRNGEYPYASFDLYWQEASRRAFRIQHDGESAGLMLLRELNAAESPLRRPALQVAEIYVSRPHRRQGVGRETMAIAADMARVRRLPRSWSAYVNNRPANALYRSVLRRYREDGGWITKRTRGIDASGLGRFYYAMTPPTVRHDDPEGPNG
jgi:predicted acetyltransferase